MDDDLKALANRIAKFKSKSKNKTYRYPGSIKKDVVKLFNQDSSQSVYVLAPKLLHRHVDAMEAIIRLIWDHNRGGEYLDNFRKVRRAELSEVTSPLQNSP